MTAFFVVCLAVAAFVLCAVATPDTHNVQIRYDRAAFAVTFAAEGAAAAAVAFVTTPGCTSAAIVAEIVSAVAAAVLVVSVIEIDL